MCPLPDRDGLASKLDNSLPVLSDLAVFAETIGTNPTCGMFQAYRRDYALSNTITWQTTVDAIRTHRYQRRSS